MTPELFFISPYNRKQILYEALKKSFLGNISEKEICQIYDIRYNTFRSLKRDFLKKIRNSEDPAELFFTSSQVGKRKKRQPEIEAKIMALRKKNLSVPDIKAILSSEDIHISFWKIDKVLKENNFPPLARRTQQKKQNLSIPEEFQAEESFQLAFNATEKFESLNGSIFLFYPILKKLNIEKIITEAGYPGTKQISSLNAILTLLALKLMGTKRLSHSNDYALDRGLGLFAGLNVLLKDASCSAYSYRISRRMNVKFLELLNQEVEKLIPSGSDFNLDFTTIPHWGDESVLENNWSNKRHIGLKSIVALLVQDQETQLLKYSDAEIKHKNQSDAIFDFVDFYRKGNGKINCLIFDSKFTTYNNLGQLNKDAIKFITLRRRSKKLVDKIDKIDRNQWYQVKLGKEFKRKHRNLLVYDHRIELKDYGDSLREVVIKNNGRDKPTFMITNDFEITTKQLVLKYARRWLVEQSIAEQIGFYHLNRLNSSIVVKVDFDLTMSVFAETIYKLFGNQIPGFENVKSDKIHRLFIKNYAYFRVADKKINITLNKKVNLPLLYETDWFENEISIPWLNNYKLKFEIGTSL